ncbi:MAG TPA: type I 3-dehydroquinate dehydratase [Vicinamibacterales bacterium]|nr:type I 3-dehydroquinate dehydratase [Vicinamibacterales bacterium]
MFDGVGRLAVVAVLEYCPASGDELAAIARQAAWLEVRSELDCEWLRARFSGTLLYAPRDRDPARLIAAARHYDLVDLRLEECVAEVLEAIPPSKRVLSALDCSADPTALREQLRAMSSIPARLYRLTVRAERSGDELVPLQLLKEANRRDVTAFATGPIGLWSRIVAPRLGAPVVFGGAHGDVASEGLPGIERLLDFGFPELPSFDELFGMVGNPVLHSYSPRIHNSAFRSIGRDALYVPFHVESFPDFWTNVIESGGIESLGFSIDALSIVSPFKGVALEATRERSAIVGRAGSTNFFRRDPQTGWVAETTDADGVLLTLRGHGVQCRNQRVAVIGCGGSGRAMAAALQQAGAHVTLVNRGFERGDYARQLLRLPFLPLRDFSGEGYSIVVNATPVGRDSDEISFPIEGLHRDAVIVDLVYRDDATPLIARTRGGGRVTVDGWDMLVTQARRQFELMTGMEMPVNHARQALGFTERRESDGRAELLAAGA